jgi:hypothetical protein
MIVQRACGTGSSFHSAGTMIEDHAVTVDILAQNVPGSYGLGAFGIRMTFPPETQYIRAAYDVTWLDSTGRNDWCDGPTLTEDGSWMFECVTLGGYTPPGPTGAGVIGHVTVLPPQSLGTTAVSLAGSQLSDITGGGSPWGSDGNLNAAITDIHINTVGCPDANLDGKVSVGDLTLASKSSGARGEDSLGALSAAIGTTDTNLPISQIGLLQVNDTIAIDAELMTVQSVQQTPPSITVTRRGDQQTPARTHSAGAIIYRTTAPGVLANYTWPRDANHDYKISVGDITLMARVSPLTCPVE